LPNAAHGHVLQPATLDVHPVAVTHAAFGQLMERRHRLLPGAQSASQLQEFGQVVPPLHAESAQETEQEPGPQSIPAPQAEIPQLTAQLDADEQLMPPLHEES